VLDRVSFFLAIRGIWAGYGPAFGGLSARSPAHFHQLRPAFGRPPKFGWRPCCRMFVFIGVFIRAEKTTTDEAWVEYSRGAGHLCSAAKTIFLRLVAEPLVLPIVFYRERQGSGDPSHRTKSTSSLAHCISHPSKIASLARARPGRVAVRWVLLHECFEFAALGWEVIDPRFSCCPPMGGGHRPGWRGYNYLWNAVHQICHY
jgi:hypothetical protein